MYVIIAIVILWYITNLNWAFIFILFNIVMRNFMFFLTLSLSSKNCFNVKHEILMEYDKGICYLNMIM